jgi:hypothetical protein
LYYTLTLKFIIFLEYEDPTIPPCHHFQTGTPNCPYTS